MAIILRIPIVLWALLLAFHHPLQAYENSADTGLTEVSLQLQWHHQFQFAGYYAAVEKGYYAEQGLRVEIRAGGYNAQGQAVRPVEEVVFERADFGSTRADLLMHHSLGLPVVVIANIMQHSPLVFLTLADYGFDHLENIGDRPVSLNLPEKLQPKRIDVETLLSLRLAGVKVESLNNSMPTWDLNDLLTGKTELMPAYETDQPFFVKKAGKWPVVIKPIDYGLDFYGDLLFTRHSLLEQKPDLVEAFKQASLRGWKYALEHPQEIVRLIVAKYPTRSKEYDEQFLLYEAKVLQDYLEPELVDIGYISRSRWERIAQLYKELGLIRDYDLNSFLYSQDFDHIWGKLRYWLLVGLLGLVLAGLLVSYQLHVNLRLKTEIRGRKQAELRLREEADNDHLTGLDNRRKFQRDSRREFIHARRYQQPLTMVIFDIDFFKIINDKYGHPGGDKVLIELARETRPLLRESDMLARIGGEEFAVILPQTDASSVQSFYERLLKTNHDNAVEYQGSTIRYSISIGVAQLDSNDQECDDLLRRCDKALYAAKQGGRNCIVIE